MGVSIVPGAVSETGRECRQIGEILVPPAVAALDGAQLVKTRLSIRSALVECTSTWSAVYAQLGATLVTVGDKLCATASIAVTTDTDAAQYPDTDAGTHRHR